MKLTAKMIQVIANEHPKFHEALNKDPHDPLKWGMYGDYLEETNHPDQHIVRSAQNYLTDSNPQNTHQFNRQFEDLYQTQNFDEHGLSKAFDNTHPLTYPLLRIYQPNTQHFETLLNYNIQGAPRAQFANWLWHELVNNDKAQTYPDNHGNYYLFERREISEEEFQSLGTLVFPSAEYFHDRNSYNPTWLIGYHMPSKDRVSILTDGNYDGWLTPRTWEPTLNHVNRR